jgi:hypothetical protein
MQTDDASQRLRRYAASRTPTLRHVPRPSINFARSVMDTDEARAKTGCLPLGRWLVKVGLSSHANVATLLIEPCLRVRSAGASVMLLTRTVHTRRPSWSVGSVKVVAHDGDLQSVGLSRRSYQHVAQSVTLRALLFMNRLFRNTGCDS